MRLDERVIGKYSVTKYDGPVIIELCVSRGGEGDLSIYTNYYDKRAGENLPPVVTRDGKNRFVVDWVLVPKEFQLGLVKALTEGLTSEQRSELIKSLSKD